mmetsp:Transcript_10117/g.33430  ORF Transcript_10117/g.33430 Transcript_10117/m.33430 type:complete len:212 (+) Transcript_10117:2496-3131(+)
MWKRMWFGSMPSSAMLSAAMFTSTTSRTNSSSVSEAHRVCRPMARSGQSICSHRPWAATRRNSAAMASARALTYSLCAAALKPALAQPPGEKKRSSQKSDSVPGDGTDQKQSSMRRPDARTAARKGTNASTNSPLAPDWRYVGRATQATFAEAMRFGLSEMRPLPPEKREAWSGTSAMSAASGISQQQRSEHTGSPLIDPRPSMRPRSSAT